MNPWSMLAWVAASSATAIILALTVAVVVSAIRQVFTRSKRGRDGS